MLSLTTARALKTMRPPCYFECRFTLRFRAKLFEKRRQRQAVLELDEIHSHDGILFNELWCQYALSVFLKPIFLSWLKHLSNQEVIFVITFCFWLLTQEAAQYVLLLHLI
jgi:hypothetical protein